MPNVIALLGGETGDLLEISSPTGSVSISSAQAHSGGYSYRVQGDGSTASYLDVSETNINNNGAMNATITLTDDTYLTFYLYIASIPATDEQLASTKDNSNRVKAELRLTSNGEIDLYENTGATKKEDGTTVLSTGQWYRIDFYAGTDSGSAADDSGYELKINGVTEYSGSDADFSEFQTQQVFVGNQIRRGSSSFDWYFDDISLATDEFVGESKIVRLDPDSDGTYNGEWTGDYTDADDLETSQPHNGDTDFNQGNGTGQEVTHNLESSSDVGITTADTIYAVRTFAIVRTSLGTGSAVYYRDRCNGANVNTSTANDPGTSYVLRGQIYPTTTPFGDASDTPWSTTRLDDLEVGCYLAGFFIANYRMTACGAMALYRTAEVARSRYIPHAGI